MSHQEPVTVLCVGDPADAATVDRLAERLAAADGVLAAPTATGPDAPTIATAVADLPDRVDCVLVVGGDALDELAVLETIGADLGTVPVVVAGPRDGFDAAGALEAGATEVCPWSDEPVDPTVLLTRIESAVAAERAERATRVAGDDVDYRRIVESMHDPVYLLDDEGRFLYANEAMADAFGRDPGTFEGTTMRELMVDEEYEDARAVVESLLETGRRRGTVEHTLGSDADPRTGETNVTVLRDADGAHVGTVGVIRDVTERNRRLQELGRYETIVETAPIGLFAVDEDGVITWHNEEFTADLGIDGEDLVGTPFAALTDRGFFPDSTLDEYLDRVRHLLSAKTDEEQLAYEEEWFDVDGRPGITEVNMRLLPLEDGEFAGSVHAFRNVTERVRYREELERQNERLEKFVGLVSHDLRNPLNVADGHLEVLEAASDHESIAELRWSIDRMSELVEDLLALARYGRTVGETDRIPLADVVADAWGSVHTGDATLATDVDRTIDADAERLRALFENLFRNAVEHGGADVTVTVGTLDDDASTGLFVADDGPGLPADTDSLFEFGYTTEDEGTGFGLAIVDEIAEAHGWTAVACEGDDGGARFEIRDVTSLRAPPDRREFESA